MNQPERHGRTHRAISLQKLSASAALFLLCAWAATPAARAQASPQSPATAPPVASGWKTYPYPSDGFSISFPSEPELSKQNVGTDAATVELRAYLVDEGSTALYVGVCDYGASLAGRDPQTVLQGAQSGAVGNIKANLLSSRNITLGAYPGREFDAENGQLHVTARVYLVGTVLYQTLVAYPLNTRFEEGSRFLDSFALIPRGSK